MKSTAESDIDHRQTYLDVETLCNPKLPKNEILRRISHAFDVILNDDISKEMNASSSWLEAWTDDASTYPIAKAKERIHDIAA